MKFFLISFLTLAAFFTEAALAKTTPKQHAITIENMVFTPAEIQIQPGDTIVWTNKDIVPHTVTSLENKFDSATIKPSSQWKHKIKSAGQYPYKCSFHPTMSGNITVVESH